MPLTSGTDLFNKSKLMWPGRRCHSFAYRKSHPFLGEAVSETSLLQTCSTSLYNRSLFFRYPQASPFLFSCRKSEEILFHVPSCRHLRQYKSHSSVQLKLKLDYTWWPVRILPVSKPIYVWLSVRYLWYRLVVLLPKIRVYFQYPRASPFHFACRKGKWILSQFHFVIIHDNTNAFLRPTDIEVGS